MDTETCTFCIGAAAALKRGHVPRTPRAVSGWGKNQMGETRLEPTQHVRACEWTAPSCQRRGPGDLRASPQHPKEEAWGSLGSQLPSPFACLLCGAQGAGTLAELQSGLTLCPSCQTPFMDSRLPVNFHSVHFREAVSLAPSSRGACT